MPHKLGSTQRLLIARLQNHYTDKREVLVKQTFLLLKAFELSHQRTCVNHGDKW